MKLLLVLQLLAATANTDPFSFFQPSVTLSAQEQNELENGQPVSRLLPSSGNEDAVFGAVRVKVDGDRLVDWARQIDQFKQGPYVIAIHRFSNPPRIEDLADVSLDEEDLKSIRTCRARSCGLKLSAAEMAQLRKAAAHSDAAVQEQFRQLMLDRVQQYLSTGEIPDYDDQRARLSPTSTFGRLVDETGCLPLHLPELSDYLKHYPAAGGVPQVESFIYWSKEQPAGKAIISMTHVNIVRNQEPALPGTVIISRDIFSSHYVSGSLSITALIGTGTEGESYLAYLNRTQVDFLRGAWSGLVRHMMQSRVRSNAAEVMESYRQRLESGEPAQAPASERFSGDLRNIPDGTPSPPQQ